MTGQSSKSTLNIDSKRVGVKREKVSKEVKELNNSKSEVRPKLIKYKFMN